MYKSNIVIDKNNNSNNNNLNLTFIQDLSIVYKPIDIIKFKDKNNSNIIYVIVAGFDATLHVYEMDSSGIIIREQL